MATVIKLGTPLSIAGQKYESLTFQTFKVEYLKFITNDIYKVIGEQTLTVEEKIRASIAMAPLLACLCNVPKEVIESMDIQDMSGIITKFGNYFNTTFTG